VQPSQVLSISYAANEINFTPEYLKRQCLEFLKLGLMGVSVIVSAADCGPAGQECACIDPETGEEGKDIDHGNFNPTTPASCPYVTVVGGTALPLGAPVTASEVAWRHNITYLNATITRTSGGGFSNIFPAPSWQLNAIEQYTTLETERLNTLRGRYNPTGRGIPDLSANAANFATVRDGTLRRIHGTSASTPVIASIIALINGKRLSHGKSAVGFLNPTLYSNAHILNDVVNGSNRGCGVDAFHATTGWDPVTGLGTPDYDKMEKLFLQLP
jgi:tripeptidyl-peptidase-1